MTIREFIHSESIKLFSKDTEILFTEKRTLPIVYLDKITVDNVEQKLGDEFLNLKIKFVNIYCCKLLIHYMEN